MPTSVANSPELIQEQVKAILIQPLEKASVILASGVRIFNTDGSPIRIPKLTSMTVAPTWVGEGEPIPDTTVANFDEIKLMPKSMKSIKIISRITEELLRQSVPPVDTNIAAKLVRDVAGVLDDALINGTGAPDGSGNLTQPRGLLNWPGTTNQLAVGNIDLDDLLDAQATLYGVNADPERGSFRWLMSPRTFFSLRKAKDSQNRYQLQPDPTKAGGFTLLGLPVTLSNRIATNGGAGTNETVVILADFSTVAVARDQAPSIRFLTELYAGSGEVGIRVQTRYDIAPTLPEAIVILRGVTN